MKFSLSGTAAGLVIRTNEVELLAMQGARVVARVRVPIEGKESSHLAQAIRQAVSVSGLKRNRFAVAIPTEDVLVRFFVMPLLPKAERDIAIQFEARKYIPFKTEALVWDYHAIESKHTHKLEVMFTAIQRHIFQELQTVLTDAGVQPTRMEPRSLSLARLAASPKGSGASPNEFVCLVDLEQEQAHLVFARGGIPYLTRDVTLVDGVNGADASPSGQDPEQLKANRLLSELRVSIDFFRREHPSTTIPKVILVGDEGLLDRWQAWLAKQLQCAVEIGRALLKRRVDGELSLAFASAVGLVRGGQGGLRVSLDFLRRSLVKPSGIVPRQAVAALVGQFRPTQLVATVGVSAAVLALVWGFSSRQVGMEQSRLNDLIRARPKVGWGLDTMGQDQLKPIQASAKQQLELLGKIVDSRVGAVAKLDALARALPDGMWLTKVSFEEMPDPTGKTQVTLKVSGACYLQEAWKEQRAIQGFEERVKNDPALFQGFTVARIEQTKEQVENRGQNQYTYRTFQLGCRSDQRL